MNEDLLNVMGSFSDTALDCIEKQNEEIEQLQQENQSLKDRIEKATNLIDKYLLGDSTLSIAELRTILKGDK